MANDAHDLAMQAKAWPFEEARKVLKRIGGKTPEKGYVLFETGYGPSGLPHIGTFGEVLRTSMVRRAFQEISDVPTRLFAFSDDMDGFRSVPDNIPQREMMAEHLGEPLTSVPDPFGTHESFGAHNNARLQAFLDDFGFDYEFVSATDCYTSGRFDDALMQLLRCYDDVMGVMLPSLGEERQKTYSPFLPVCEKTGKVLQVPVLETNPDAGTIVYQDDYGTKVETSVTGGRCKIQWKPDWAMRWYALGVDYEMSGKDLIDRFTYRAGFAALSADGHRRVIPTSCSWTKTARRYRSRAAMGSPSKNGSPTHPTIALLSSCSRSRGRQSAFISTSFPRRSTNTSRSCASFRTRTIPSSCQPVLAYSRRLTARRGCAC